LKSRKKEKERKECDQYDDDNEDDGEQMRAKRATAALSLTAAFFPTDNPPTPSICSYSVGNSDKKT